MKPRLLAISLTFAALNLPTSALEAAPASGKSDASLHRAMIEDWMVKDDFAGFLSAHPDLYYHRMGAQAFRDSKFDDAMRLFRKSARYADKHSQAMIAGMYWNGDGVAVDRGTAYAWMDLAAERNYPLLVRLREAFWFEMTDAERERALDVGAGVYETFGDDVAQQRIARALRGTQRNIVGSRTGFRGMAQIVGLPPGLIAVPQSQGGAPEYTASTLVSVSASDFYADAYWNPKHYFQWREARWTEQFPAYGTIGPMRAVDAQDDAESAPQGEQPPTDGDADNHRHL